MAEARVGTSGWSYPEWVGRFYPVGTKPARMLPFYARRFDTVEAHGTYRRLPTAAALERWAADTPGAFRFAPKVHLGITHRRDLDGVDERVAAFLDAVAPLGDRLGPMLFSLPHRAPDLQRLDRLLAALPTAEPVPAAFELGPDWYIPEVLDRLDRANATVALVEADGRPAAEIQVGPFTYLRLRRSRYTRADLEAWAEKLAKTRAGGRDAYVFFKHDEHGDGPRYARRLMARLGEA